MSVTSFFKAYDLRGTTPELNAEIYYLAAIGFVEEILKKENLPLKVSVLHDARSSSSEFYAAVCQGLSDAGAEAICLGLGTTDLMYAACQMLDTPGMMVTASHNPKDDNGLKIVKQVPQMLGLSTGLDKIRDFVLLKLEEKKQSQAQNSNQNVFTNALGKFKEVASSWQKKEVVLPPENEILKKEVLDFFLSKVQEVGNLKQLKLNQTKGKKLKVLVDCGNGMGGFIMPYLSEVYQDLVEFVPLFWELDGTFPNHPADPMVKENLLQLQAEVLSQQADFGIAMDGDADRAFFVDEKGSPVSGEFLVALFAKYMLQEALEKPQLGFNPAIGYVISYGRSAPETILENNGVPIVCKQGHTFIKMEMKKYNCIYAGEASGHHYFGQFGFMDSGALAIALFLRILAEKNQPASQLCAFWQEKYFVSGEHNFRLPENLNMAIVKEKIKENYSSDVISELDGITVYGLDWKFTIRGSNTEPLLRINIEYKGQDKTQAKMDEIKQVLGL